MKLRVSDIENARVIDTTVVLPSMDFSLNFAADCVLLGPVAVKVRAAVADDEVLILGEVAAEVRFGCSRCLKSFATSLTGRFEIHESLTTEFVDIMDESRQALLIDLPVKPLCRPQCRGICSQCGRNLNEDSCACPQGFTESPFAKLKSLLVH